MKYLFFSDNEKTKYRIAILVNKIRKDEIIKEYITPFNLPKDDVIVIDLHQAQGKKKTPAAEQKRYIEEELQPVLNDLGVEYIFVADAEYFKTSSKTVKADANLGHRLFEVHFLATLSGQVLVSLIYHRKLDESWEPAAKALAEKLNIKLIGRSRGQKFVLTDEYVVEELSVFDRHYKYKQIESSFTQPNAQK